MALNSTHPLYVDNLEDWMLMRHSYAGERVVKEQGVKYLPPTPGQILDGMDAVTKVGFKNYEAYKKRAVFHDFVSDAVETYMGFLHKNPATFEVPDGMKEMIDRATDNGEPLAVLLRRINEQQLVAGRLGLLLDLPLNPDPANPLPYVTMYVAETCRNWDDSDDMLGETKLELAVLDETGAERTNTFEWVNREKYRVLLLASEGTDQPSGLASDEEVTEDKVAEETAIAQAVRVYKQGLFYTKDSNEINEDAMTTPMLRGQTLDQIPFVFINSKDIVSKPDNPPLLGLARLAMTIYRGEADYRHHLFMQGQDTLVIIGGISDTGSTDEGVRVGAGAHINVDLHGDAKYIGVNSAGLSEVRASLENDKMRAEAKAGSLATKSSGSKESGEALNTRLSAQTATLTSIALAGAAGLEKILKIAASWMGQDPEKVKVTPNLEFGDLVLDGKAIMDLMAARTQGAPISLKSIHALMVERNLTKLEFEEELDLIDEEDAGRMEAKRDMGIGPTGLPLPDPTNPLDPAHPDHPENPANLNKNAPAAGGKGPASA